LCDFRAHIIDIVLVLESLNSTYSPNNCKKEMK